MRDNITGATFAPDTHYQEHRGGISSEIVYPSGAIRCYGTDPDGYTTAWAARAAGRDANGHWPDANLITL